MGKVKTLYISTIDVDCSTKMQQQQKAKGGSLNFLFARWMDLVEGYRVAQIVKKKINFVDVAGRGETGMKGT